MSWSISKSGTAAEVKEYVDSHQCCEQLNAIPHSQNESQYVAAKGLIQSEIHRLGEDAAVKLEANGHADENYAAFNISLSIHKAEPAPPPAEEATQVVSAVEVLTDVPAAQ